MATIKRKKTRMKWDELPHIKIDFGVILFMIVFVYILIQVIMYVNDSDPVIFTVEQSTYDTDFTATGIAVRNETIVTAPSSGSPCYYVRDGEKVSKGANIFAIDSSGTVQAAMDSAQTEGDSLLTSADYSAITSQIEMFKNSFSNSDFGNVYSFKMSIDSKLLEIYEELALENVNGSSAAGAVNAEKASFSGLVTYYQDGYENVNLNDLTADIFDRTTYNKQSLKSDSPVNAGDPVCKIVNDEEWKIAISLTEDEYNKISQNEYATFTINDSSRRISTTYDKIEKDGKYYIVVSFNKYMAQYVNERFLDINFQFDESNGLKIPDSAIITKDVYMIPVEYMVKGGSENTSDHFMQIVTTAGGKESVEVITPVIYYTDDRFCYVDPSGINSDAVLRKEGENNDTFSVATAAKYSLKGVLCVSKGTAEFRRIEAIASGDDYSIVRPDLTYGISRYDRILLDGTSKKEGDLIY